MAVADVRGLTLHSHAAVMPPSRDAVSACLCRLGATCAQLRQADENAALQAEMASLRGSGVEVHVTRSSSASPAGGGAALDLEESSEAGRELQRELDELDEHCGVGVPRGESGRIAGGKEDGERTFTVIQRLVMGAARLATTRPYGPHAHFAACTDPTC